MVETILQLVNFEHTAFKFICSNFNNSSLILQRFKLIWLNNLQNYWFCKIHQRNLYYFVKNRGTKFKCILSVLAYIFSDFYLRCVNIVDTIELSFIILVKYWTVWVRINVRTVTEWWYNLFIVYFLLYFFIGIMNINVFPLNFYQDKNHDFYLTLKYHSRNLDKITTQNVIKKATYSIQKKLMTTL